MFHEAEAMQIIYIKPLIGKTFGLEVSRAWNWLNPTDVSLGR